MRGRAWLISIGAALVVSASPFPAPRIEPVQSQQVLAVPVTEALAQPGVPVLNGAGVYLPPAPQLSHGARVLLALHGQGGTGPGIAQRFAQLRRALRLGACRADDGLP